MTAAAGMLRLASKQIGSLVAIHLLATLIVSDGQSTIAHPFVVSLVKDIHSGPQSSYPRELVTLGDHVFFAARDSEHGSELWMSDGTESGTTLAEDIFPGPEGSNPEDLYALTRQIYFEARDSERDWELWAADGETGEAIRVLDIRTGPNGSFPQKMVSAGGKLYFTASDEIHGLELWVTDGTAANTHVVKEFVEGAGSSVVSELVPLGDQIVFSASAPGPGVPLNLYITDGTAEGTRSFLDLDDVVGAGPSGLFVFQDSVIFSLDDPQVGQELWSTDGTSDEAKLIADVNPSGSSRPSILGMHGEQLLFQTLDLTYGNELWATDGTESGTTLLAEVHKGDEKGRMVWLGQNGENALLFAAPSDRSQSPSLWKTDGTREGTTKVTDFVPSSGAPGGFVASSIDFRDHTFLTINFNDGQATELWVTDGTEEGSIRLAEGTGSSSLHPGFAVLNDTLLVAFSSANYPVGLELFAVRPVLAGDFSNDVRIDQADLDLVLTQWGTPPLDLVSIGWEGDPPLGTIDQDELDKVLLGWGTSELHSKGLTTVPEPSAFVLAVIGIAAVCCYHTSYRRKGRKNSLRTAPGPARTPAC